MPRLLPAGRLGDRLGLARVIVPPPPSLRSGVGTRRGIKRGIYLVIGCGGHAARRVGDMPLRGVGGLGSPAGELGLALALVSAW